MRGRLEQASGGTLFLDEIGDMSPLTQASLLQMLKTGFIRRLGGVVEIPVNVRILCATDQRWQEDVECGRFSEELYTHLTGTFRFAYRRFSERRDDIPALVHHFLKKHREDRKISSIEERALSRADGILLARQCP